jgi:hypothetical protein
LNVQGEVGNLRIENDDYGLELVLVSAERLSYLNVRKFNY